MSLSRRNPKRDANEKTIKESLEAVGAYVLTISGKNRPDLIVLFQQRWYAMGVKMPKGKLTKDEQQGVKWPLVRSPQEAWDVIGVRARLFPPGSTPWVQ